MITDDRLRHLSSPDYAKSEPGQIASELLEARERITALEAQLKDYDAGETDNGILLHRAETAEDLVKALEAALKWAIENDAAWTNDSELPDECRTVICEIRDKLYPAAETSVKPESRECCPFCGSAPRNPCDYAYPHPPASEPKTEGK